MLKYTVKLCPREDIENFIEKWHYSHSINGVKTKYCFKLMDGDMLIGAAIMAKLGMANVWKKYGDNEEDVIELRRLCCIDDTPKNTESYFISQMVRWLRANTSIKVILSYADQYHNHTGIIYKASNFEYLGTTNPSKMIEWNGKLWHDKTIRTYYNGKLKPYAQKLKDALDKGEAKYVEAQYKHIYRYIIVRKINPRQKT
jgi:hypothetical protein